MDLDKQIAELDNEGALIPSSPKAAVIRILAAFLVAGAIVYLIRPMYVLKIEYDNVDDKCKAKINMKPFLMVTLVIAVGVYYIISKYGWIN